jgi:hypothetical protein
MAGPYRQARTRALPGYVAGVSSAQPSQPPVASPVVLDHFVMIDAKPNDTRQRRGRRQPTVPADGESQ